MTTLVRTLLVVVLITGMSVVVVPASADELQEYLEKAAEADYAGRRVVVTVWDGRSRAEFMTVEHAGDVMMFGGGDSETLIGEGRVTVDGAPGVALSGWSAPHVGHKYQTGDIADARRLGRDGRTVTVYEGDMIRARIVFDLETWAPLSTEIFDGDGSLFRIASFTEFDPNPQRVYVAMQDDGHDYDVVAMAEESTLPSTVGGYERVDVYQGPDDAAHSFYSDGLFSFSVFEVSPRMSRTRFSEAESVSLADAAYLVIVNPTELWVTWEHNDEAFVLVGDLPPDHLEEVLADLPAPRGKSFFERLFSVFG